jgi:thermopsin/parallel beta helix pectate lyase-like protein
MAGSRIGGRIVVIVAMLVLLVGGPVLALALNPGASGGALPGGMAPLAGVIRSPASIASSSTPTATFPLQALQRGPLGHAPALSVLEQVKQEIATGQLSARDALFPSAFRGLGPTSSGAIPVAYPTVPAPMGLSDLGTGANGTYIYNTSSFEGNLSLLALSAFSPGYAGFALPPDWMTIQLNTVAVNVSYPGSTKGEFWLQNVVFINGTELQFEDNIWNFSSSALSLKAGTLLTYSGRLVAGQFYYAFGPPEPVSFPLTLHLINDVRIVSGRPVASFNYSLAEPSLSLSTSGTYDTVTFNGLASSLAPPQLQVNGGGKNPAGLLNDAELIFGGPGAGSNANVVSLNGSAQLDRMTATGSTYQSIPSAYDFGVDTGETALGVAGFYWGTTDVLTQGPSMLYGLWRTVSVPGFPHANPGWIHIRITVSPIYAFVFATDNTSFAMPLPKANLSYAPSDPVTGLTRTNLPPPPASDPYVFAAWANGNLTGHVVVSNNTTAIQNLTLASSSGALVAPIYLQNDLQAAAYGKAGIAQTGYASGMRTLWLNSSSVTIQPPFLRLNDFRYPTFVLLATDQLSTSVVVNGLVQDPTTFSYTYYTSGLASYPGWTQGYYFFYGSGRYSVSNTTLEGNPTLFDSPVPAEPPGSVSFFGTQKSVASSITTKLDSFGVAVLYSSGATLTSISGNSGANAIALVASTSVVANKISANGTDPLTFFPTWGAFIDLCQGVTLTQLSAANTSDGIYAVNSSRLTVTGLNATSSSTGVVANGGLSVVHISNLQAIGSTAVDVLGVSNATLANVRVTGFLGTAGIWIDSDNLSVTNLTVVGPSAFGGGLDLDAVSSVTVNHVTVSGAFTTGIDQFDYSTHGRFSNITASGGAIGLTAFSSVWVGLSSVKASTGSVGAELAGVYNVSATDVTASGLAVGLIWDGGKNGTVRGVNVTSAATGVYVANVTNVSVAQARGTAVFTNLSYFYSSTNGSEFPIAVVATYNDSLAVVANISAVGFAFAVWDNLSKLEAVSNVTAWAGGTAVAFNSSSYATIQQVFAYGNQLGVSFLNSSHMTLTGSTLEGSASYGVTIRNGTVLTIEGNNFVANNGASVSGSYSSLHVQATTANATYVLFHSNYWSDHPGSGSYTIKGAIVDSHPLGAFVGTYVRFIATGLATRTTWQFSFASASYSTTVTMVYVPGWSLPSLSVTFVVAPVAGYPAPSPGNGTVDFTGDTNVTISFGSAGSASSGLPLWVYVSAGLGAGAVLALVGVLVARRRRRGDRQEENPFEEDPFASPPQYPAQRRR